MKARRWLLGLFAPALVVVVATAASCGDEDTSGEGGAPAARRDTGEPCTTNADCLGSLCLTDETFASLSEGKEANIPGGYCSSFDCTRNTPSPEVCGPDGYCFDLEPYTEAPIWACFDLCDTGSDCRTGYVCTDAQGSTSGYPPLPYKACLPPDLLCLLDVTEYCGDAGTGGGGGTAGSGGGGAAGGSGGGGTAGSGGGTAGGGGS